MMMNEMRYPPPPPASPDSHIINISYSDVIVCFQSWLLSYSGSFFKEKNGPKTISMTTMWREARIKPRLTIFPVLLIA